MFAIALAAMIWFSGCVSMTAAANDGRTGDSDSQTPASDAQVFFSRTNVTVSSWTVSAVQCKKLTEPGIRGYGFYSRAGSELGRITRSNVHGAGTPYANTVQGWLDAFNDYRALPREKKAAAGEAVIPVDTAQFAQELIDLTNRLRREAGLSELQPMEELSQVALIRVKEYAQDTTLGHMRPDGTTGMELAAQYSSRGGAAENLSWNRTTPQKALDAWMESEGHRKNILNPDLVAIGTACIEKDGALYWCQTFIY
ncbi:CAP domain-containing protein [Ruminococcaceae bacterium OttesenSCG-928-L11]|nr:CAP domain-containing protein [Ruminococcaceae bacterium OttesenSCG-928-L11]